MSLVEAPVWFITGCSSGFGRELAKLALSRGWRVVVTARHPVDVEDLVAGTTAAHCCCRWTLPIQPRWTRR